MTEERLQEIKDSVEFQYTLAKAKGVDNALLFTNEEEELIEEIERLNKENEYLNNKHEKIIHNIMEFIDKNTFNHRNTGERILTLHGKGILDLLDICLGSDKE